MKRILVTGAMFLMLSAVGIAADTKTDYDHSVNFSTYHSFAWKAPRPAADEVVSNSLVMSRIREAVTEQLTAKGMTQNVKNPDVYVVAHVGAQNQTDIDYLPAPGGWRHWRWMGPDVIVQRYVEGTIILDMVDAKTNRLVWRAASTETGENLLDVQKEKKVDKMIEESFKHFPPETTSREKR